MMTTVKVICPHIGQDLFEVFQADTWAVTVYLCDDCADLWAQGYTVEGMGSD